MLASASEGVAGDARRQSRSHVRSPAEILEATLVFLA